MTAVEAIYENGVLKLQEPVALAEGAHVRVFIEDGPTTTNRSSRKTPAEIMAEIAAQSNPTGEIETGSIDHDKYLYGWAK